jgi:amidase
VPEQTDRPAAQSTDVAFAGAARQAELIAAGELSSRELVELYLGRIERIDPQINAYRTVMAERALTEADQADRRRTAGEERPLLGVPVAIKDTTDVAGELSTQGTAAYGGPATEDAELVRRLRAAGAVVIGKTNLPELAITGTTESPVWGVTRNPWDLDRTPGGSSGGSGAAVAAGLAAMAHATDGAGSIRIPASCCGLFGLKPQRDRVSLAPDSQHWYGMSVAGAVTRTVLDNAIFLDAVSADTGDRPFAQSARTVPGELRVAVSTRFPLPNPGLKVDPAVRGGLDSTAGLLRSLGHRVEERDPDYGLIGNVSLPRFLKGIQAEADTLARPDRLQRRTRGFVRLGRLVPQAAVDAALRDEAARAAQVNRIFDHVDVLMTPVSTRPPVGAQQWEGKSAFRTLNEMARVYPYTGIWNATGQPAASVPAGFTDDGLPLSVQLVGRPGDEHTLLSLAAQIEAERPWADRRPPV